MRAKSGGVIVLILQLLFVVSATEFNSTSPKATQDTSQFTSVPLEELELKETSPDSHLENSENPENRENVSISETLRGNREGRGLLDTIQSFVQTAQSVNKLFGGGNIIQNPIVQSIIQSSLQNHNQNQNQQQNAIQNQVQVPSSSINYQQQIQNQHHNQNYPVNYENYQQPLNPSQNYYQQPIETLNLNGNYASQIPAVNTKYENHYGNNAQPSEIHPNYPQAVKLSTLVNNHFPNRLSIPGLGQSHVQGLIPTSGQSQSHSQNPNGINVNKQGFLDGLGGGNGAGGIGGLGGLGSGSGGLLSTLGELGIGEDLSELLSFASVDKVLKNVNKFDSLQCIPRLLCQMVAKRQQEAAEEEERQRTSSTTTSTTTRRPKYKSRESGESARQGRLIPGLKIQGVDTALEQVVKFLDLMQLKDWTLYPYLKGAYHGNQVKTWNECAEQFKTCPFSEDQLLYYFNNYKGGLFQSFRADIPAETSNQS